MRSVVAGISLLIAACGPVLLVGDAPMAGSSASPRDLDAAVSDAARTDSAMPTAGGDPSMIATGMRDAASPAPVLSVTPSDCGHCFNLAAEPAGGVPPFEYQWDDGSRSRMRRVCVEGTALRRVTVVVQDATGMRSAPGVTLLAADDPDSACPPAPPPGRPLCVMNPSFEGAPSVNVGQNFDGAPWNTCSNDPSMSNTPDIGNDSLVVIGNAPKAVNGSTYLALGQGEQVSQVLCEDAQGGQTLSFQLQVSRVDLAPGDTTKVFLEVWGGIGANCTQRQLLWASPPLASVWTSYCVTMKPIEYMNQITLRANTDVSTLAPEYLVVDNLVPVRECP